MYTNHFNVRKEYQSVEPADDIEISNKDDEERPEITQDLVGLISKDEKEERRNERVVSLKRVKEDLVPRDLPEQRGSSSRIQNLRKSIRTEILREKR